MPFELHQIGTRDQLRVTFDDVAQLYDQMRPSYPDAVFDDVIALSGVDSSSHVLEIGCGTGHATQAMASRGLSIDCVELGANMADVARRRLAQFPRVRIEVADFDDWDAGTRYELVYLATAYHWLNPATRKQRIAALIRKQRAGAQGWLAIWRNRHIRNGSSDDFIDEARVIYLEEAPELTKDRGQLPRPDEVVEAEREVASPELFEVPITRVYHWSRGYSAAEYVQALDTHSDHRLLPAGRRARLFQRLAHLIDSRFGGSVIKDYATVLQLFRRVS